MRRIPLFVLEAIVALGGLLMLAPQVAPIRAAQLVQDQQAIDFTDRNGLPLGTLLTRDQEHTVSVPLERVSPQFLHAIVAAEDGRFYRHGPVEARALARSIAQFVRRRRVVSGASTISMQLARMLRPVPAMLRGKLYEMWIAARLEAGMSKDEILTSYVNRLAMGGNIYGVEAAARTYFDVSAGDLNLAQATLLAALPNDPTRLGPYEQMGALKRRQAYVLERMIADGYISRTQANRARAEQILLKPRNQGIIAAPHFLFWLAAQLPPHTPKIRTTIDRPLQEFVEEQVRQVMRSLVSRNVRHAAAVVVDNHSGEVLAYVGSPDYFSDRRGGRNDGVQALRQPGSTLKPFLYELALESRAIRPNTILADVPAYYALPGARLYSPSDYNKSFQGPVRVRIALANSLNVPAVRVLERVGVPRFLDRLRALEFAHLTKSPDYYGLGLTLGGGEVSLWELTGAYVTIARQGVAAPLITHFDTAGKYSLLPYAKAAFVGDSSTWALVTDILADTHARAQAFGVDSVLAVPFPAAVKTGTSSDFRDTWTVGFSRDYTVGVWVGNFEGDPMRQVSGVAGAGPLWNRIMLHLHERQEPAPFDPPQGLVRRPICALSGLRPVPDCPTVVLEYFYPEDLADYQMRTGRMKLSREYDDWLANQPAPVMRSQGFKILFPHDGDRFVLNETLPGTPLVLAEQKVKFESTGVGGAVEWSLNGRSLATRSNSYFWQVRPGAYRLRARSGGKADEVVFSVGRNDILAHRGFSIARP